MQDNTSIAIERVFNLGDYKSLRVNVVPNELGDEEKRLIIFMNVFDAYQTLFTHQLIAAELNDDDAGIERWSNSLQHLRELKTKYIGG